MYCLPCSAGPIKFDIEPRIIGAIETVKMSVMQPRRKKKYH